MATHRITQADIKDWAKNYKGELFDGILCDPPYELGFMGKSWDSSGIAFDAEMWSDIYKLLKPGGHLLAFSGSRTYHRMAVAIEDAGFEIRDMIEWVYGSGFPKSLNIAKKLEGVTGTQSAGFNTAGGKENFNKQDKSFRSDYGYVWKPTDERAKQWEGYGTALKPAHEPCVLARKPLDKGMTVANNVLKHGTGGLNIDGTRVEAEPELSKNWTDRKAPAGFNGDKSGIYGSGKTDTPSDYTPTGRFPANLILSDDPEVEAVFPQTKSGAMNSTTKGHDPDTFNTYGKQYVRQVTNPASIGSASRFFYTAKASKRERNAGLEDFEPQQYSHDGRDKPIENAYQRNGSVAQNHHPTVKPLSLTKYLATLIKPPTGGRLLVPFSGSGSEMIGALQAGWGYVEGVELTEEYIPIAEARIKYWLNQADKDDKQGTLL